MEADFKSRKQVNLEQLKALVDFLKEHQELAKGLVRGRRGKLQTFKLWNLCAKRLNGIKDGATKDGKGWSKYWCDWKYRVRRRTLELKVAKDSNRPPPDGVTPLSHLEEDILTIIGENSVEGVIIKCDPLGNGDTDEDGVEKQDAVDESSVNQVTRPTLKPRGRKRRLSREVDIDDVGGPSSPRERKQKVTGNGDADDTDMDEEASQFLSLEREKLYNSKKMCESIQTIASEITRLADVMGHIRDLLMNSRVNL